MEEDGQRRGVGGKDDEFSGPTIEGFGCCLGVRIGEEGLTGSNESAVSCQGSQSFAILNFMGWEEGLTCLRLRLSLTALRAELAVQCPESVAKALDLQ